MTPNNILLQSQIKCIGQPLSEKLLFAGYDKLIKKHTGDQDLKNIFTWLTNKELEYSQTSRWVETFSTVLKTASVIAKVRFTCTLMSCCYQLCDIQGFSNHERHSL